MQRQSLIGWSENRRTPGGSSEKPHPHQQRRQNHQDEESHESRKQCNTFGFSKEGPPLNASFLPQLSHWRSCPNAKPLASVYVKFMGQEIAFVNIDQSLIEQAIQVSYKDECLSFARQNRDDSFCRPAHQGSICMEHEKRHRQESGIWRRSEHRQAFADQRGEAYHAHRCWSSTGAHSVHRCSDSCKCKRWAETSPPKLWLTFKQCYYVIRTDRKLQM